MRYSKKLFTIVAMALCFSLCMGMVSNAETVTYTETKYGTLVNGLKNAEGFNMRVDSSGRLVSNLTEYKKSAASKKEAKKAFYARVVYTSNGKKTVNNANAKYFSDFSGDKYVYGSRVYNVVDKGADEKQKQLVVYNKKGKAVKKIKIDISKYIKNQGSHYGSIGMAEIVSKNKVRLYFRRSEDLMNGCGGMLEVNISTGKIKKLFSEEEFVPSYYDGNYVYNCIITDDNITFYRKSLKTGTTDKFTVDALSYDEDKYRYTDVKYSFYNGKIMVLEPTGKVYYGDFDAKTFEQVGDISNCKNFSKYAIRGFAMKSRNEFYALYDPSWVKDEDSDTYRCGKMFIVKYKG